MHNNRPSLFSLILSVLLLGVMVLATIAVNSGGGSDGAVRAIENNGLTDVRVGDWAPMACGGDTESRHFTAKRDGKRVSGVVCCGLMFKSCTVRW